MAPIFRLESVTRHYGERLALEIPELVIEEGGIRSLSGPNGSGKSTLLGILAFLSPPTSGVLYYDGKRVEWKERSLVALRREVTLLHQSPYLFEGSVHANIAFGLGIRGMRGEEKHGRIEESLETVGLGGFGHRRARALSGGETQRVALARALALAPRVLLLDEPLANVDRDSAVVIRAVIAGLPARGTTVIMTTHDPDVPGCSNGEVIRLEEGRLSRSRDEVATGRT
ncbi:MAG: ATP-binding cassette domain-containing protein [Deltaproteobacteria bacterium]|nr:ATP-binding cassette domain-containing protein [Deltaproteobacteria bacterium]